MNEYMTSRGLQSAMSSWLIETAHTDNSILHKSGPSKTTTLDRYHRLQGMEGLCQQKSLFQSRSAIDTKMYVKNKKTDA